MCKPHKTNFFSKTLAQRRPETKLPYELEHDCRLKWFMLTGEYFFCEVKHPAPPKPIEKAPTAGMIALDPGVMTFQAGYDLDNYRMLEFGKKDMARIEHIGCQVDRVVRDTFCRKQFDPKEARKIQDNQNRAKWEFWNNDKKSPKATMCKARCKEASETEESKEERVKKDRKAEE